MGARVGFVVVSHSRALAEAVRSLAAEMVPASAVPIEVAGGLDETTFGTDAVAISDAVGVVGASAAQVVVLMDLGSAVLSAEMALELVDDDVRGRTYLCPAPLVEGLVVGAVAAAGGADAAQVMAEASGSLTAKAEHLTPVSGALGAVAEPGAGADAETSGVFEVIPPHGLHARPVALLVAALAGLDADVRLVDLSTGAGPAPASSPTAVAGLGAAQGHRVRVLADGPDAREAVARVVALAERGFAEAAPAPGPAAKRAPAVGTAHVWRPPTPSIGAATGDEEAEWARLEGARAAIRDRIADVRELARSQGGNDAAAIFDAHLTLLDDSHLLTQAREQIGGGAAAAWQQAVTGVEQQLAAVPDPYLQARAADVRAIGDQVLRALAGEPEPVPDPDLDGILVADDLTPADVVTSGPGVVGFLLAGGSPLSHAAILAGHRGVPWVSGAGPDVLELDGQALRLSDGSWERP